MEATTSSSRRRCSRASTSRGCRSPFPDGGVETLSGPQTIQACNLVEFQPDGGVVWTWKATDHFDAVADSVYPTLTPYGPVNSLVVDPFHCNSIDVDPNNGNLLFSAREMAALFYIERSSGRVLWKMGSPCEQGRGDLRGGPGRLRAPARRPLPARLDGGLQRRHRPHLALRRRDPRRPRRRGARSSTTWWWERAMAGPGPTAGAAASRQTRVRPP